MLENKQGVNLAFYHNNNKYIEVKKNIKIKEYFNKPKIIMTFNGSNPIGKLYPVYYDKQIGSSTYTMYYIMEGKNIKKHVNFLNSKLLYFLMILTQYSPLPRNKNDHKIINKIQIPNLNLNPTEQDIYKYYGITKEEQKLIEQVVDDKKQLPGPPSEPDTQQPKVPSPSVSPPDKPAKKGAKVKTFKKKKYINKKIKRTKRKQK